jgi:hypothetical protein
MKRALPLLLTVALATAVSCSRCGGNAPVAGNRLTEKDTTLPTERQVHDRDGGTWTLTMPDRDWRVVNDDARTRLRGDADVWVVNPVRDLHLTVQCTSAVTAAQLEPALKVAAQRAGRTYTQVDRATLDGPWVRGVELTSTTSDGAHTWTHVDGLFDLLGRTCDVQATATDPLQVPLLHTVVRSFVPQVSPAGLALLAPLRTLSLPNVQAHLADLVDAGIPAQLAAAVLVARGMPRLPEAALDERFTLRRHILEALPDDACGALIARLDDPGFTMATMEQLEPGEAQRWGQLTVEAINAELSAQGPVELDRTALAEAQRAWLALEGVAAAEAALKQADQRSPADVCGAERHRLKAAFTLERPVRALLFRSWLAR